MVDLPAPIGGTVLSSDFAPAVVFAALYGLLALLIAYRLYDRRSRTTLLIGSIIFSVERIVIFSLRASQARNDAMRYSGGLLNYMQVSFGLGFVGLAGELVGLLRCLLVNATYGSETFAQSPAAMTKGCVTGPPPEGTPDLKSTRFAARRFADVAGFAFLAATVPGIIANADFSKAQNDQDQADKTARLRYASTATVLGFILVLFAIVMWGRMRLSRISRRGVGVILLLMSLLATVAIYRLIVMRFKTTSIREFSPLNSPGSKATFYVFHMLPEWLFGLIVFGGNSRQTFGTGRWGDWRSRDETEKEKALREKKKAESDNKKAELNEKKRIEQVE
ncbi:unnamed protein product [Cyclocybe aegerita]|uniref:Uncharacterized protein n=1 Tax=Cyclocybe aegerita TaxID=1973307 RepID=A0A8S0VXD2_CYCAE|nr:unnamed protein product [Cyclocybe aegerita]